MPLLLDLLEGAGELDGEPRYGPAVRAELEAMSAATIDRYLAPAGARAVRGRSTTKAGPLLRSSIKIRRAGGRGGGRARVLRGRHRRPLRSGAQGGVRPDR